MNSSKGLKQIKNSEFRGPTDDILHPVTILQFTGGSKRKNWRCCSAVKINGLWSFIFFALKLISCSRMCIIKYKYIKQFRVFVVYRSWKSLTLARSSQNHVLKVPKSIIKCKEFLFCWKDLWPWGKNLTMDEAKEEVRHIYEGLKIHPAGVTSRAL